MDMLHAYRAFLRVAETGSFSRAAEEMRQQQSQISRMVAALESQLGVQLLRRTTRSVTITEEGERYRMRLASILHALDDCESEIRTGRREPSGLIRVACPTTLGRVLLVPIVNEFLKLYGKVSVELLMNNNLVNLAADGIDIAVRVGRLPENELPTRQIGIVEQFVVASPAYLSSIDAISDPDHLLGRNCFCFATSGGTQTWSFSQGDTAKLVNVRGDFIANDAEVLMQRCLDGLGVAMLPRWLVWSLIAEGRLERLLPNWQTRSMQLSVVTSHRSYRPQRISAFLAFLEMHLKPFLISNHTRDRAGAAP
jgi:DNA-binding transcriptional LysR family regulator